MITVNTEGLDGKIEIVNLGEALRAVLEEPPHHYLDREGEVFDEAKRALRMRKTILWIEGPMGCGKSTLARYLARHLDLECFLENPDHPVIRTNLQMLYSGDFKTQKCGAVDINEHYLGFRMADYGEALRRARSAVLDRISHADDLYMTGFVEDGFMTQQQVEAIRTRRKNTLDILRPTNTLTAPIEIAIQLVGTAELFERRKNNRARGVEIAKGSKGVPLSYMKRLTTYYQEAPGLPKLLADAGYRGPMLLVPQEISDGVEFQPNDLKHLVPILETITKYVSPKP